MNESILKRAALKHREDILEPYDDLMGLNGFDAICAFCDYFGGSTVYIPRKQTIFRRCLELEAIQEFNGANYQKLVRKYGMSESHLRKILHERKP